MKSSKFKITAFILTVLIIFSMTAIFSGCGGNDTDTGGIPVDNAENGGSGTDQNESEPLDSNSGEENPSSIEARPDYELPEKDFNGSDFRIISRSETSNLHWWNYDISAEAETGDPINDAIYQRNKKVEELYNITIVNIPDNTAGPSASRSIRAGSDDYDLVVAGLRDGQEALLTQGLLMDLHAVPLVDLAKPWWDQKAVEQLSINNRLYATACDLTIRDKDAIIILMFSKTLIQNLGLDDPYALVTSGQWTLDRMHDMMKVASRDLDGDGAMGLDDQYGLLSQYRHTQYLFNAAGEYVARLNADKVPEITIYSQRAAQVVEKIAEMQGDRNIAVHAEQASGRYSDIWDDFQVPLFAQDRALFYHAGMNRVTLLRTMENDFGIIPPPKFDESQANYYASVDAWCTSTVSIPITVSDKERAGLILETLAYESRYILLPAYYDINLKTKFARDEESGAMIDIILNNRLYDLGDMYYWGGFVSFFENIAQGRGDSLATFWERNGERMISAMERTMERIDDLE